MGISRFKATSSPTTVTIVSKPEGVEFTISGSAGESIDGVDVLAMSPSSISLLSIFSTIFFLYQLRHYFLKHFLLVLRQSVICYYHHLSKIFPEEYQTQTMKLQKISETDIIFSVSSWNIGPLRAANPIITRCPQPDIMAPVCMNFS